jgi:hypothetical protein
MRNGPVASGASCGSFYFSRAATLRIRLDSVNAALAVGFAICSLSSRAALALILAYLYYADWSLASLCSSSTEPHHPPLHQPPSLRGIHPGHHRVRDQGRRDRRKQPGTVHQEVQGGGLHCYSQVVGAKRELASARRPILTVLLLSSFSFIPSLLLFGFAFLLASLGSFAPRVRTLPLVPRSTVLFTAPQSVTLSPPSASASTSSPSTATSAPATPAKTTCPA